jgi:flagellar protein FlaG
MAIKAVDPIADIGVAREVKLLQTQSARRNSQRPAPPEAASSAEADQAKAKAEQPKQQQPTAAKQAVPADPSLRFRLDQDTGKTVAELVDPEGQVLRQMPTEEALEIAKAIGKFQGAFVDVKV